ncbi:Aste57867_21087 [Aphanomyces stellatus]|uniref:Aste57867_21087 protein n=1 Tax=Aphanomyces stellatus TaxID=120398 RepID=A0A485LI24_9STRA|nr:hypothetical protein As57867_021019 [Aphanomyces stellatus]VFT97761.1 Aste57867_21087 [Aphanomyces stellatus]
MDEIEMEQTLFQEKNVWIYKVPILTGDPRADQWDVEKPLLTGALRVVQTNDVCVINLYEANQTLFAQCPIDVDVDRNLGVFVQDCVDSSRYFVLRIVDPKSSRAAFVGIGLPERSAAFNFKAALLDFAKYKQRMLALASKLPSAVTPPKDLSLPEGTKMRIQIGGKAEVVAAPPTVSSDAAVSWQLAPPPPSNLPPPVVAPTPAVVVDDDDWGDFK